MSHPLWYQLVGFSAVHSFPLSSAAGTFACSEGEKVYTVVFSRSLLKSFLNAAIGAYSLASAGLTGSPFGLEDNHPRCYRADEAAVKHTHTHTKKNNVHRILRSSTGQRKLTVCGAEVSGNPSDLSPAWGTHKYLLIQIYTASGQETPSFRCKNVLIITIIHL